MGIQAEWRQGNRSQASASIPQQAARRTRRSGAAVALPSPPKRPRLARYEHRGSTILKVTDDGKWPA